MILCLYGMAIRSLQLLTYGNGLDLRLLTLLDDKSPRLESRGY
jgi:hypothetical protein